jgi:hypothetical protein
VTARFPVSPELVEAAVQPAIRPSPDAELVGRVRFWDLRYESLQPRETPLAAAPAGSFREAIVALPARFGDEATETTAFMWTDSATYLTWGREEFGWPTLLGEVDLDGDLWTGPLAAGTTGAARCRTATASIALTDLTVERARPAVVAGSPSFVTVRRVARRGSPEVTVEAVRVKMQMLNRGRRFELQGTLQLSFEPGHPLYGFAPTPATIEAVEGVTCVVGEDVETLPWTPPAG